MITTIDVLLFSSQDLLFGVYAEQIEELLTAEIRANSGTPTEEYITLYRQQELRVIDFSVYLARKRPQTFLSGAEKTTLNRPDITSAKDSFSSPKILVMKRQNNEYIGIHVEDVIKILTMTTEQIQTFPKIMEKRKRIPGLWGCALVEERFVMLIDLTQLA